MTLDASLSELARSVHGVTGWEFSYDELEDPVKHLLVVSARAAIASAAQTRAANASEFEVTETAAKALHQVWFRHLVIGNNDDPGDLFGIALIPYSDLPPARQEELRRLARQSVEIGDKNPELVQSLLSGYRHGGLIEPQPQFRRIVRNCQPYVTRLDTLRLDMNEQIPDMGNLAWEAFRRELSASHASAYPETSRLFEALEDLHGIPRDRIALSEGSDAAIRQIFHVFLGTGKKLLLTVPRYGMYEVYGSMFDAEVIVVECEQDFSFDPRQIMKMMILHRPAVLAVAQPNGALGSVLKDEDLESILITAQDIGVVVILDEAHIDFYRDMWISRIDEFDNLLLLRTFSKAGGLAGFRFGYMLGSSWLISLVTRARPVVEINSAAAVAALILINNPSWIRRQVEATLEGKSWLANRLEQYWHVYRGNGNFIQVCFDESTPAIVQCLREAGIRVRDQSGIKRLARWVRISGGPIPSMESVWGVLSEERKK